MTILGTQCNECQGKQDKCWWPKTPVQLPIKSLFSGALGLLGASSASPSAQMLSLDHYQQAGWVDILVVTHLTEKNIEKYYERDSWFPITVLKTKFCEVDPRKSKIILWCWTKNKKDNDSASGISVWPTRCCEVSAANSTSSLPQKTSALNHPIFWISYQQGGYHLCGLSAKMTNQFFWTKKRAKYGPVGQTNGQKCCLLTKDTWFLPPKVAK